MCIKFIFLFPTFDFPSFSIWHVFISKYINWIGQKFFLIRIIVISYLLEFLLIWWSNRFQFSLFNYSNQISSTNFLLRITGSLQVGSLRFYRIVIIKGSSVLGVIVYTPTLGVFVNLSTSF